MKAGAFSEEQAKDLLKQLLETTRYLQSFDNPILHRDINPSNVILDNKGRYNLADFGIAAIQAHGTINGTECGTAGYAAPEQIVLGKASASSEVYSIGATVISMLTGKPPYDMGNDWQEDFISHADISPGFAAVLKRMVAVNKDERCQNSAEASQALEHSGKVIALAKSASASSNDSLMKDLDNLDKRNTKAKKAYEKELGRKAADILHLIRKMLDMRKRIQAPHTDYQHGEDRQYIELWNMSCRVHTKGEKDIVNIDPHPERVLSVCVSTLVAMPGIITLMVDHFQNRIFTSIGFLFIAVSLATFAVSYSIENAVNRFNNIRKIKRVLREFPGTPETVVKLAKKVRASIVEKNNDLDSNTKKLSDKGQAESSDSIERKTANASPSDNSGGAIIKSSKPKIRVTSITTQDGQKKIRVKREEKAEEASAEISSDGSKKSKGSA